MPIIKNIYNIILEALFPRSLVEVESLSYSPEEALVKLSHAPEPPLANAYSIFAYKDERVAKLVWNIKYKNSKLAVAIGGYALFNQLPASPNFRFAQDENTLSAPSLVNSTLQIIIVPIPITMKRRKERGYNQCELLVDEMKRLDMENKLIIYKDLLERVSHLSRQTLKNREDRLESARGIFVVNEETIQRLSKTKLDIKKITVIIIDDVITTGSTMKEAMNTLKNAGFENVFGLSLAH